MRGLSVKPLFDQKSADTLCERILHGEGAMIRSLSVTGPSSASLRLSVQDKQRGYDWIDITLAVEGMNDARLVDDNKLKLLDTDGGISIVFEAGRCGVAIGRYGGIEALKNAPLYILGGSLKYEEAPFSG